MKLSSYIGLANPAPALTSATGTKATSTTSRNIYNTTGKVKAQKRKASEDEDDDVVVM